MQKGKERARIFIPKQWPSLMNTQMLSHKDLNIEINSKPNDAFMNEFNINNNI